MKTKKHNNIPSGFQRLNFIYELTKLLNEEDDFDIIFSKTVEIIVKLIKCDRVSIITLDENGVMNYRASYGLSKKYMLHLQRNHSTWVDGGNPFKTYLINDVEKYGLHDDFKNYLLDEGIKSYAYIPLATSKKHYGKIIIYFNSRHNFKQDEIKIVETITSQISAAYERNIQRSELERKNHLLNSFIDALPDIVFYKDKEGRNLVVNNKFETLLGKSKNDIIGYRDQELLPPGVNIPFIEVDKSFLKRKKMVKTSDVYNSTNGKVIYETRRLPVLNNGKVEGVIGICSDVTERIQAEEKIARSERDYRGLFENAHDAIIIFEPENEIVLDVNDSACKLYGFTREEFIGTSLRIISTDLQKAENHIKKTIAKELKYSFDVAQKRKDGSLIHVEVIASLVEYRGRQAILSINRDITEKKKAQDELRESRELYRSLFESSHDAIVLISLRGKIILANKKSEQLFGKSLKKYNAIDVFEKDDRKKIIRLINDMFMQDRYVKSEYYIGKPCKEKFPAEISIAPVYDSNGKPSAFTAIIRDISEQKENEAAIRQYQDKLEELIKERTAELSESEEKFRALTENTDDIIIRFNRTGEHLYVNPALSRLTNINSTEIIGKNIEQFNFPKEFITQLKKLLDIVFISGKKNRFEYKLPNDTWLDWLLMPEFDDNGKVKSVITSGRDITDKKIFEAQFIKSNERWRTLFEYAPTGFFIMDQDGTLLNGNKEAENISGYSRFMLIGKSLFDADLIVPPDKNKLKTILDKSNKGISSETEEINIKRKDGSIIPLEVRTFPMQLDGRQVVFGNANDISMRKRAEVEVQNALEKLKELNSLRSRFVSMVSHEFRTPLATMLSSIELLDLLENSLTIEEKKQHYTKIINSIDYLTQLLNDVITINKADAGKLDVNIANIDVVYLIKSIKDDITNSYKKGHLIHFGTNKENLICGTDEKLLRQAASNLIENAVKYTPDGKNIFIKLECNKDEFVLTVEDEGIGIPESTAKNIFSPFYRGSNIGEIAGTGLGLTVAKKSVESLNGEISFSSKVNTGTKFVVRIPNYPVLDKS